MWGLVGGIGLSSFLSFVWSDGREREREREIWELKARERELRGLESSYRSCWVLGWLVGRRFGGLLVLSSVCG
jgi:hypothetical protein